MLFMVRLVFSLPAEQPEEKNLTAGENALQIEVYPEQENNVASRAGGKTLQS